MLLKYKTNITIIKMYHVEKYS